MATKAVSTPFVNHDLKNVRREYFFEIPKALADKITPIMTDMRDMPMIHLLFNIAVLILPSAFFLFTVSFSGLNHLLGVAYIAMLAVFLPRFILCMHYSSHRFVFTKYGPILNNMQTYVLAPFFGIPSGMYYLHHVVMHHCEGNIFPEDWSSTMTYQRDNFLHFMHYWAKFFFTTYFYLPYYAIKKGRNDLALQSTLACMCYFLMVRTMLKYNTAATMYVFVLPQIITSFALMFGNWSQHMFLDPSSPESPWGCTFNAMNCEDNKNTFNDGYHIVHHVHSRLHWSEMPSNFMQNLSKYSEKDCIVIDGIGFFDVGIMVMMGRLDKLAEHVVQWGFLGGKQRTIEETVAMMKERLVPMPRKPNKKQQ